MIDIRKTTTFDAQKGFTLIEIMVVIFIIGLMMAIVAPNLIGSQDEARAKKALADITNLEGQLTLYKLHNGFFPTTDQGLEALVSKPTIPPEPRGYQKNGYIKKLPLDPWNRPYQYIAPGENGPYEIYSLGADGEEGGEDDAADIGTF